MKSWKWVFYRRIPFSLEGTANHFRNKSQVSVSMPDFLMNNSAFVRDMLTYFLAELDEKIVTTVVSTC